MKRYTKFNIKRKIAPPGAISKEWLSEMSRTVRYSGNPEHKRSPGDFGLTPPASPRRGKSLCDVAQIYRKIVARKLLQRGLVEGAVSIQHIDGWPKQVWSVRDSIVFEAQYDAIGSYHGYPLPDHDPHAAAVKRWWKEHVHV